jgi:hypothetical protein
MERDPSATLASSILGNFNAVRRHVEQRRVRSAEDGGELLGLIGRECQRHDLTGLRHAVDPPRSSVLDKADYHDRDPACG